MTNYFGLSVFYKEFTSTGDIKVIKTKINMKLIVLIFFTLVFFATVKANTTKVMLYNTGINIKYIDTCVENLSFKSNYLKSLQYIEGCVDGRKTNKKQIGNCIDNMIRNSGIRSSVYYGYIFRYREKTDFYTDKKKWLSWYEKNKCRNLKWRYHCSQSIYLLQKNRR